MIKLQVSYSNDKERETLLKKLGQDYLIIKESKEYKNQGPYKKIYIDLKNK